jgi:hypothetical protein
MEPQILFVPSAFKHGIQEKDIRYVFKTHIYDKLIAGFDNKYAVIGFDHAGNLLEVMYNRVDDEVVKVFHAMRCRQHFIKNLGMA